jgi:hypothetical protein
MFKVASLVVLILLLTTPFASAQNTEVSIELSLLVDTSGSVSSTEFELQKQGYESAFRSQEVRNAIAAVGSIAVNFIYWSSSDLQQEAIPFTQITSASSNDFADLIAATSRPFSGGTFISDAIDFAVPLFDNQFSSKRQIIDISGDGVSSRSRTEASRDSAIAAGIDAINGLPIGGSSTVNEFYVESVIAGADSFIEPADTFEDFRSAVIRKIVREVTSVDQCPQDPAKVEPGVCGCGVSDIDRDGDATIDCLEQCPNDPTKVTPGVCGCGFPDTDANRNGVADCSEAGETTTNTQAACSDGLDNDGDGFFDFRSDSLGDPGCSSPSDSSEDDDDIALKSPAFAKFNTYLGQQVYAEIVNDGKRSQQVTIDLYNLRGSLMISRLLSIPASKQQDVDVNALLKQACKEKPSNCLGFEDLSETRGHNNGTGQADGIVDTYGLVKLRFDDSKPDNRILGRVSFYRPSPNGGYSFAFARELRNPSRGKTYTTSNTYDPQGLGSLVPNWAEVISLGRERADGRIEEVSQSYTLNIYSEQGILLESRLFSLPALGEFDFQAGHEFTDTFGNRREGVYLIEIVPVDKNALYFLSLGRYSSKDAPSGDAAEYHFALSLEGKPGTKEPLYVSARNSLNGITGLNSQPIVTNWIETACVDELPCRVEAKLRSASGIEVGRRVISLLPKSQYHLNAGALLEANSIASVELISDQKIVSQSMVYLHSPGSKPLTGYSVSATSRQRKEKSGSLNTNLGIQNLLTIYSSIDTTTDVQISAKPLSGSSGYLQLELPSASAKSITLSNELSNPFPENQYGTVKVESNLDGSLIADVLRIRKNSNNAIDFVMPTAVR